MLVLCLCMYEPWMSGGKGDSKRTLAALWMQPPPPLALTYAYARVEDVLDTEVVAKEITTRAPRGGRSQ